jgi:hypothetical protein
MDVVWIVRVAVMGEWARFAVGEQFALFRAAAAFGFFWAVVAISVSVPISIVPITVSAFAFIFVVATAIFGFGGGFDARTLGWGQSGGSGYDSGGGFRRGFGDGSDDAGGSGWVARDDGLYGDDRGL